MESHEVTGIRQGYHVVCYLHQLINGTKKSDTSIVSSVLHWASSGLWSAKSWYLTCKQLRLTTPPVQRCSSLARQCEWQPLSCAGRHGSPWQEHWERTSVDGSALPPSWGTKVRPCILVTSLPSLLKNTKLHKLHQPSSKWVYLNENNPYLSSSCQTFSLQSGCPSPGKSRSLICIRELCQLPPSSFLGSHSLLLPCLGSISFCWVPGHTDGLVPSRRQSHVLRFSAMAGTPHLPISWWCLMPKLLWLLVELTESLVKQYFLISGFTLCLGCRHMSLAGLGHDEQQTLY